MGLKALMMSLRRRSDDTPDPLETSAEYPPDSSIHAGCTPDTPATSDAGEMDWLPQLLNAAMAACDRYGDSEAQRQQMREDCLNLPPHLRLDLLQHFSGGRKHDMNKKQD